MIKAKWKNPYFNIKKINSKIMPRNFTILPSFVNKTFQIHNGKLFTSIIIKEEMIGYKFGEFIPTRKKFQFRKKNRKK